MNFGMRQCKKLDIYEFKSILYRIPQKNFIIIVKLIFMKCISKYIFDDLQQTEPLWLYESLIFVDFLCN